MALLAELRRRSVIRGAIAYAVVAWLLIDITSTVFPVLKLPTWSVTPVTVLLLVGFPVALILAWAYELTPAGVRREKAGEPTTIYRWPVGYVGVQETTTSRGDRRLAFPAGLERRNIIRAAIA